MIGRMPAAIASSAIEMMFSTMCWMASVSMSRSSAPTPGESFTVEPHDGEEFGYVVEGSVVLVCDGEEHPLRRGETFYLHGRSFHLLKNVRKTTAHVLWVSTPPLF